MYTKLRLMTLSLLLCCGTTVEAHSGGTNASGCHTKKATGEYHCHNKKAKTKAKTTAPVSKKSPAGKQTIICTANIYNCLEDFGGSHTRAQHVYKTCLKQVGTDVHDLDRDSDGIACEALQ